MRKELSLTQSAAVMRTDRHGYHPEVSLHLAELSALAYRSEPEVNEVSKQAGWASVRLLGSGATEIYAIHDDHSLIFVARDPGAFAGRLGDLLASRVRWTDAGQLQPLGRVHRGFLRQASRAQEVLTTAEKFRHLFPSGRTFVAGHSLGGALAYLLTVRLAGAGIAVTGTYTFSAPRPGNGAFADWYGAQGFGQRTHRVVSIGRRSAQDLVTRVPASALGWRHPGLPAIHTPQGVVLGRDRRRVWQRLKEQRKVGRITAWRILLRTRPRLRARAARSLVRRLRGSLGRAEGASVRSAFA